MQKIEYRIHKLEVAMAKFPPSPEPSCGAMDWDAIKQKIESDFLLAEHTDPFVRLKHVRDKIHQAELKLAAEEKCKTVLGSGLAKISLPINHHHARDAELEILERAGFDTGELRATHQKHAANPYKWPYRANPLPSEAQTILDRIAEQGDFSLLTDAIPAIPQVNPKVSGMVSMERLTKSNITFCQIKE